MASSTSPYAPSLSATDGRSAPIRTVRRSFFSTSVGTKVLIGATGLLLFLYLVLHVLGNALIFFGPRTFNGYSQFLISNPLIVPVEIGLLLVFLLHVYKTVTNWANNRRARPNAYYKRRWAGPPSRKSIASSTMIWGGLITFAFVLVHLQQFKFGTEYQVAGQPGVRDLYRTEVENFSSLLNVGFYMVCMAVVGSHLWHGFSSAFQSLGLNWPWLTPFVLKLGKVLAVVIAGGFLVIPIWVYLYGAR
jgi:succinate dehydrogenase / fumarate reductase cytochrome b subunit